jgi:hypothetical protein
MIDPAISLPEAEPVQAGLAIPCILSFESGGSIHISYDAAIESI